MQCDRVAVSDSACERRLCVSAEIDQGAVQPVVENGDLIGVLDLIEHGTLKSRITQVGFDGVGGFQLGEVTGHLVAVFRKRSAPLGSGQTDSARLESGEAQLSGNHWVALSHLDVGEGADRFE